MARVTNLDGGSQSQTPIIYSLKNAHRSFLHYAQSWDPYTTLHWRRHSILCAQEGLVPGQHLGPSCSTLHAGISVGVATEGPYDRMRGALSLVHFFIIFCSLTCIAETPHRSFLYYAGRWDQRGSEDEGPAIQGWTGALIFVSSVLILRSITSGAGTVLSIFSHFRPQDVPGRREGNGGTVIPAWTASTTLM